MEPLDEQTDARHDPIDPKYNSDENPVDNTDEQFMTARVVLVGEELVWRTRCFGYF
jgi:hypothetical protein